MIDIIISSLIYLIVAFIFTVTIKNKLDGTKLEPLALIFVIPFVIFDWLWNLICGTIMFLDPPEELFELATGRLHRYKSEYEGVKDLNWIEAWRWGFTWRMGKFLNAFDPNHYH